MATKKKGESTSETVENNDTIVTSESTQDNTVTETSEQYIPEIPAQLEVKEDTDEIRFLKNILHIQENGGFGRHLHGIINERIKELQS